MCRNHKRSLTSSKRQQRVPWWRIKKRAQPVPLQTRALRTTGFDEAVSYHPRRIHLKLPATIGRVSETVSPLSPSSFDPTLRRFRLCGFHQSVSQFVSGRQPLPYPIREGLPGIRPRSRASKHGHSSNFDKPKSQHSVDESAYIVLLYCLASHPIQFERRSS
jgi:hypothetical protein